MVMIRIKEVAFIAEAENTLPNNGYLTADLIVGFSCFALMYIVAP